MADKNVGELIAAQSVTPADLFVLEQNGTAKKLTGQILENWLVSFADGHGGIQSIVKKSTSGLVDTYRITLADATTFDFMVSNGKGVNTIEKTKTSGLVDTYTIRYNDSTSSTFTVTNGKKGDKGDNSYIWIKYASKEPTTSSNSFGDIPDNWIGVYFGTASTAPTNWQQYKWFKIKGEKGDTGAPATLVSSQITYQVGSSGTIVPSGSWNSSIPSVAQGKYLWTRQVLQFNTGNPITSYIVARFGIDGTGAVSSVAGVSPDWNGNVPLSASDVGALSSKGGTMEGSINMNGQKLTGLNTPTANSDAVNKRYVDQIKDGLEEAVKDAAAFNYADNSDFTQLVNQAGFGASHAGSVAKYAGDRWILDSGTVTGDAREDGNGYTNIKLNGTIRQIVANAPDVGTAFVEMVSGTATIAYANGEITITSNGGVIKNVMLLKGVYTDDIKPMYQPKGYSSELSECQMYYWVIRENTMSSYVDITGHAIFTAAFPVKMRLIPTLTTKGTISVDLYGLGVRTLAANNYYATKHVVRFGVDAGSDNLGRSAVFIDNIEVSSDF